MIPKTGRGIVLAGAGMVPSDEAQVESNFSSRTHG